MAWQGSSEPAPGRRAAAAPPDGLGADQALSTPPGSFGYVVLARDNTTGEAVAVKVIRRGEVNKYVEGEITNHGQLRHPHVIQFREVFLTPEDICIAMEYATGGTLFAYVSGRAGRGEGGLTPSIPQASAAAAARVARARRAAAAPPPACELV